MSREFSKKDDITGVDICITYAHHEIHSGCAFKVHYSNITANSDDDRSAIAFTTPAGTKKGHWIGTVSASSPAEFFMIEAPTNTDATAGTDMLILNRDRNSGTASIMASLEATPTVGSASVYLEAEMVTAAFTGGLEVDHTFLRAGSGPQAIGGDARGEQEFILKVSTTYLFYLQNIGANANTHSLQLDWYEHTDA